MKWYFASNDRSARYDYMIRVAVESALKNTTLTPVMLYDGEANELTRWLTDKGVRVIHHRSSFYDALEAHYPEKLLRIATGAFLRCDIPILEEEDEVVLYTDCDVIFNTDIELKNTPKLFACAPETDQQDTSVLNTGVMVMNIPGLRKTHSEFVEFIKRELPSLDTYDQTAYNRFYVSQHDDLGLEYNWKPYWGKNHSAIITHFHGPKPKHMLDLMQGRPVPATCGKLFHMDRSGCIHYLRDFCNYCNDPEFNADEVMLAAVEFLAEKTEKTEEELRLVKRKLLWPRLRKNLRKMIKRR